MPSGITETRAPPTCTPEPCAISQASAPTQSPSRGVPCAPASVRNQPATPRARQTSSVLAAASGAGERGQEHERAPVAQVALQLPRRRAGAVGHQRGHRHHLRGPSRRRTALPRRRSSRIGALRAGSLPWNGHGPHASPLDPRSPEGFEAFYKDVRGPTAPPDLRADRRPARRAAGGPRRDGRGLAPLAQGLPARPARGLRAPAGLDPRPAPQQRALVGPAEGPRRRRPRHPRRARAS